MLSVSHGYLDVARFAARPAAPAVKMSCTSIQVLQQIESKVLQMRLDFRTHVNDMLHVGISGGRTAAVLSVRNVASIIETCVRCM